MATIDLEKGVIRVSRSELKIYRGRRGFRYNLKSKSPEVEQNIFRQYEKGISPLKKLTPQQVAWLRLHMPAAHACIEFLKGRMVSFNYRIKKSGGRHNNLSLKRAERVEKLLQGPNQFGHTFKMMMNMWFDNLLERDVGVIEKAVGILGTIDQIGVNESRFFRPNTIDDTGKLNPKEAYIELSAIDIEKIINTYKQDQIVWSNLNPQPQSFYGLAPLEVLDRIIIMSVYADQHNMKIVHPNSEKGGGIVWLGDIDGKVREEFEERYDDFRRNDPTRPIFTGSGSEPKYLSLDDQRRMEWDKLQSRFAEIVASCFGLNLRDIGIQTAHGNSGTAVIDDMITLRSAIIPRMNLIQDILTVGVVAPAGGDDLSIEFITKREETLEVRTRAASMAVGRGALTLNEMRNMIDDTLEPYGDDIGNEPFIIAGNQVMKLKDIIAGNVSPQQLPNADVVPFGRTSKKKGEVGTNTQWQG